MHFLTKSPRSSVSFTCIYLQSVTNVRLSHSKIYQVSLQNKNKQYVFGPNDMTVLDPVK